VCGVEVLVEFYGVILKMFPSQMLMQALKWCCDHMNAPIAEVSHFYMRKGEVVDLDPPPVTLPPVVKPVVVKKTEGDE